MQTLPLDYALFFGENRCLEDKNTNFVIQSTAIQEKTTSAALSVSLGNDKDAIKKTSQTHTHNDQVEDTSARMLKNSRKAILEHNEPLEKLKLFIDSDSLEWNVSFSDDESPSAWATVAEGLPTCDFQKGSSKSEPLNFSFSEYSVQGKRNSMEDEHFFIETEKSVFCAVFDGHGGKEVSEYASSAFKKRFFETLHKNQGNVFQTFEILFTEIHTEVSKKAEWNNQGTTAVICHIDKQTNQIITATLGDSEAFIVRKIEKELKLIPLSCVRNWGSKKDAQRAAAALGKNEIINIWPMTTNAKDLRFPPEGHILHQNGSLNVSRSIGDLHLGYNVAGPAMTYKSKITSNQLKAGDFLLVCCDGLTDYMSGNDIRSVIENALESNKNDLARELGYHALYFNGSSDNITAMVAQIT